MDSLSQFSIFSPNQKFTNIARRIGIIIEAQLLN